MSSLQDRGHGGAAEWLVLNNISLAYSKKAEKGEFGSVKHAFHTYMNPYTTSLSIHSLIAHSHNPQRTWPEVHTEPITRRRSRHIVARIMRSIFFESIALLAVATSALPTDKPASISSIHNVEELDIASSSAALEKRSWFEPNVPCVGTSLS